MDRRGIAVNIDKIVNKIEKYADQKWDQGWDAGFESGMNSVDSADELHDKLSFRMSLIFDSAMKDNKFREAKIYKDIIEYLELTLIDDPYNSIEVNSEAVKLGGKQEE